MKSNTKKMIMLTVFALLIINTQYISFDQENNDDKIEVFDKTNLKSSGFWDVPFISINGNWSFTEHNKPWCNGSGTWDDPYIIENVTIDAGSSPTGSGIYINNSKNEYFKIKNCTVYNADTGAYDAGIFLENTNNGTLIDNNCSNNGGVGIFLYNNCKNNTISNNTSNNNTQAGIRLEGYNYRNTISGNIACDNGIYGIYLTYHSDENRVTGNTASNIKMISQNIGIYIRDHSNGNIVSGNTANNNTEQGIELWYYCHDNIILGNTANNNLQHGIRLWDHCAYSIVSGNTANNNLQHGILLEAGISGGTGYFAYNIISGNTANNNLQHGILLEGSYGISTCDFNNISGNTVNNNTWSGIHLRECCGGNYLSRNTINGNRDGIYLSDDIKSNNLLGNIINNNLRYGIYLEDCDDNNYTGNNITNNTGIGAYIYDDYCGNNLFYNNSFIGNGLNAQDNSDPNDNQWDNGIIGNYWDNYIGVDANDDGIGDTPYTYISGAAGSQDNFPIWDDGIHIIIINSPDPNDAFGEIAPTFNVSINFPILDTTWYTFNNSLNNYTFTDSFGTINQTAWDTYGNGIITIIFYVNNTAGNISFAEVNVFKDTIAPMIDIEIPTGAYVFEDFAPVYDITINDMTLDMIWYTIDEGMNNITITNSMGTINQTLWDTLPNGYVYIRFYARDLAGNIGFKEVIVIKNTPQKGNGYDEDAKKNGEEEDYDLIFGILVGGIFSLIAIVAVLVIVVLNNSNQIKRLNELILSEKTKRSLAQKSERLENKLETKRK